MSSASTDQPPRSLAALEQQLKRDLHLLCWPAADWMPARHRAGQQVVDVAIIGAGQAGLVAAAALQQLGIKSVVFDRAPRGSEGPWATTARMETLRSPKQLLGPALGVPALTFRAWFEAQFGLARWEQLDKIPRLQWMDYLNWYRRVMAIDVRNDTEVLGVHPQADGVVRLRLKRVNDVDGDENGDLFARRVVLATGRDGLGGALLPDFVKDLPRKLWAHSSDPLDYSRLKGKRVGVVGAGASAMDSAATALEAGAASVDLLIRRADIPRINKSKAATVPGNTHGHSNLPDAWKWRIRQYINAQQVPPPRGSTLRVSRHDNARFNLDCAVLDVEQVADGLAVHTPKGTFDLDFLIVSTGFRIDWFSRPEFAAIAPHIRAWRVRYRPPPGEENEELASSPDVGPVFELRENAPGVCPGLDRIHCFCFPATLSHGTLSGDIPSISEGARRLANGMASLFYSEDIEQHFDNLQAFSEPELQGDEWTVAPSLAGEPSVEPSAELSAELSTEPAAELYKV